MGKNWSPEDVPRTTGRVAVVTGSNTGLGYATAKALAGRGYHTVLACRNTDKAEAARRNLLGQVPEASVEVRRLDTGSMASVRNFAEEFREDFGRLDILVNNAGIMTTPYFETEDGFEGQLAVNYLGHFLLTGLLVPTMANAPQARVVTLYSLAHRWGGIQFDDMLFTRGYDAGKAYFQSKMACLMFALELNQRLQRAGHNTLSVAAHPGISSSDLGRHLSLPLRVITSFASRLMFQSAEQGALPALYAALSSDVKGGETIGPDGRGQRKGWPAAVEVEPSALRQTDRDRLWRMSEELTGFSYDL